MPRILNGLKVATEQELLDFANAIRKAGGANALEALLPSTPGDPKACLIANALNFSCEVGGLSMNKDGEGFPGSQHGDTWFMTFPENMDVDRIRAIAKVVPGVRFAWGWDIGSPEFDRNTGRHSYPDSKRIPALRLPRHIGNAAEAFDDGRAFQEYRD